MPMKKILLRFHPFVNKFYMLMFKRAISELVYIQFIKHLIVGGGGAVINYVLFNIMLRMHINILIANTITNIVVVIITFAGQKFFTYQIRDNVTSQIALFLLQSFLYYLLDTTIVYILINLLTMSPMLGKFISILLLTPLSFIFNKLVVFKTKQQEIVNA
jgi:putative flippase GtrA